MMNTKMFGIAGLCALTLTACQEPGVKEQPVSVTLVPASEPARAEGMQQTLLRDGAETRFVLNSLRDGHEHWSGSEGCRFSRLEMFAPSVRWQGCEEFADGTQEVTRTGKPWPLKVGHRWSYDFQGSNANGYSWSGTRTCEVEGTARVATGSTSYDTYKVLCDDQFSRRTFYVLPADGEYVKLVRYRKRSGQTTVFDRVSGS